MIQVYLLNVEKLNDKILFRNKLNEMSEIRQKKISEYFFHRDKILSLGAGLVLNFGLQEYGLTEKDEKVAVNKNGKPYLINHLDIHFNLSHSGNYVLGAFDTDEIGVDIEKVVDISIDIAKKFLSLSEYKFIIKKHKIMQNDAFFRLWVLKESFMKAVGLGMSIPLNEFEIVIKNQVKVFHTLNQNQYYFKEFETPDYKFAICSTNQNFSNLINITDNIF